MKQRHIQTTGSTSKTGLKLSPDGSSYAVDWTELPSSDHFFLSTGYRFKKEATSVKILFGASTSFDECEHYDLAVEIHFPIREAKAYLHDSLFKELGGNGKTTFYDSVMGALSNVGINTNNLPKVQALKTPKNRETAHRIFPANFVAMSYTGTQALIEFFEVTPDLIHFIKSQKKFRPFSGVKPVISIILDTATLLHLMNDLTVLKTEKNIEGALYE